RPPVPTCRGSCTDAFCQITLIQRKRKNESQLRRIQMKLLKFVSVSTCLSALLLVGAAVAQVNDPGVRNTGVNAGQPFASISANANDLAFFNSGKAQFNEHQTVTGDNVGLGPRYNRN